MTRGRVVFRAIRGIRLMGTIQLAAVRLEAWRGTGAGRIYRISLAGYKDPVYIRGGGSSDAIVLYQIFGAGEYKLATALESVNFILDAGANIGLASLYFLRRYPKAKIMAVEPDSANFELCRKNLEPYRDALLCSKELCGAVVVIWCRFLAPLNGDSQSGPPAQMKMPSLRPSICRGSSGSPVSIRWIC